MFKKLILESLSSPAAASELNRHIVRLRKEKRKRKMGLIFVALAATVHVLTLSAPPESANSVSSPSFIDTKIHSLNDFVYLYDKNSSSIRDLINSLGVTREEILASTPASIKPEDDMVIWSPKNLGNESKSIHTYNLSTNEARKVFYSSTAKSLSSDSNHPAFIGKSSTAGKFAILMHSGEFITSKYAMPACNQTDLIEALNKDYRDDQPADCNNTKLETSLSATNLSSERFDLAKPAESSDSIMYTLQVKNLGNSSTMTGTNVYIADLLEYSNLTDSGGGIFDNSHKSIEWPDTVVDPGGDLIRTFTVKILSPVPSTAIGAKVPSSYDCIISTSFGNMVEIPVACTKIKTFEKILIALPKIPTKASLYISASILFLAALLYLRLRQTIVELNAARYKYLNNI